MAGRLARKVRRRDELDKLVNRAPRDYVITAAFECPPNFGAEGT
jgi:hypothetical protein